MDVKSKFIKHFKHYIMKRLRDFKTGRALSKFDMACQMGNWRNLPWDKIFDVFSYSDMVSFYTEFCNTSKN